MPRKSAMLFVLLKPISLPLAKILVRCGALSFRLNWDSVAFGCAFASHWLVRGRLSEVLSLELSRLERSINSLTNADFRALLQRLVWFKDPVANVAFLNMQLQSSDLRPNRLAALSVLSYALWCPCYSLLFRKQGGDESLSSEIRTILDVAVSHVLTEDRLDRSLLIFLNDDADPRVIYDLALRFPHASFMAIQTKMDAILKLDFVSALPKSISLISARYEIIHNTPEDVELFLKARKVSHQICRELDLIFTGDEFRVIWQKYLPAAFIMFEGSVYAWLRKADVVLKHFAMHRASEILLVSGPDEGYIDPEFLRESFQETRVSSIQLGSLRRMAPEPMDDMPSTYGALFGGLYQHFYKPFFTAPKDSVVVVSNFNSQDFRARRIGLKIVESVAKRARCVAVQRSHFHRFSPKGKEVVGALKAIAKRVPRGNVQICFGAFRIRSRPVVRGYRPMIEALSKEVVQRLNGRVPALLQNISELAGHSLMRACMYFLLYDRLPHAVSIMSKSEATFSDNKIRSILFNIGDKYMENYCMGIAAAHSGAATFQYNPLFICESPKYVTPLSYYSMVTDGMMVDSYQKFMSLPPERVIAVGSHMVDDRRSAILGLNKSDERIALGIPQERKYVITFASQPIHEPTVRAVKALMDACAGLPVQLIIKLHPTESPHKADIYHQLAREAGAADWVRAYAEGDLNKMMIASDLVVTLFSNVGLEAAILDRNVLTIKIEAEPFPVDLEEMELAVGVSSVEELRRVIPELLQGGAAADRCIEMRRVFLERNPQLVSGSVEERIADHLLDDELWAAAVRNHNTSTAGGAEAA